MRMQKTKRIAAKILDRAADEASVARILNTIEEAIFEYRVIPADIRGNIQRLREQLRRMDIGSPETKQMALEKNSIVATIRGCVPKEEYNNDLYETVMKYIYKHSRIFHTYEFDSNPYYKNIRIKQQDCSNFKLKYISFQPHELFRYDISRIEPNFHNFEIPCVGCFDEEFIFPALIDKEDDLPMIAVSPSEIITLQEPLKKATGHVAVFGCKLGYFAYMASLKEDVTNITIIENNPDIIDIFTNQLLPQFEHKDKIQIIHTDEINYLQNMTDGAFDYCFVDLWATVNEADVYFAAKEASRQYKKTKLDYWIERDFANRLSQFAWLECCYAFEKTMIKSVNVNATDEDAIALEERKMEYMHKLLKKIEIKTPEEIDAVLTPENLIKYIEKTKIIF